LEIDMNIIVWLVVGGLVGWVASKLMNSPQGVLMDVVVGVVGAVIGGWLTWPLVGSGTINSRDFSVAGLAVSLLGAVVLLAIMNVIQRRRPR
jgi:uncharacterized membrane protein YeaQ/YmgE (transglycosylase-associated protein family)